MESGHAAERLSESSPKLSLIDYLRGTLREKSQDMPADEFTIRGVWEFAMRCQPRLGERLFKDSGCLVATHGLGASFRLSSPPAPIDDSIIGRDGREVKTSDTALQVAILDSCYSILPRIPRLEHFLSGSTVEKSVARAKIVGDEVKQICDLLTISRPSILLIGYVKTIADCLRGRGMEVLCTDLDAHTIGTCTPSNTKVLSGGENAKLIAACDVVVTTGFAITTLTLHDIFESARAYHRPVVVFAQTGSNFAPEYLNLGASVVVAENYPWYSMPGPSVIKVFRRL